MNYSYVLHTVGNLTLPPYTLTCNCNLCYVKYWPEHDRNVGQNMSYTLRDLVNINVQFFQRKLYANWYTIKHNGMSKMNILNGFLRKQCCVSADLFHKNSDYVKNTTFLGGNVTTQSL
jgi:predicted nucleic acid binding AN1-type Zn finger protein